MSKTVAGSSRSVDTLIEDLQNLFKGHSVSDGLTQFKDQIGQVFIDRLKEREHQSRTLSLSMIGKPLRQIYYELTNSPREELSASTRVKFLYGDLTEAMMGFLIQESGHSLTDQQREVEVDSVPGHIDGILDGDTLIDIKSCSPHSFNKFKDGTLKDSDVFGYISQLSGYWACLPEIKRAGFFAFDKQSGRMHWMELDESLRQTKNDISSRIKLINEVVAEGKEPKRCYSTEPEGKAGNERLGIGCSYCAHKFHCWRDANNGQGLKVYLYSTGPKYFTKIVKEPRVNSYDVFTVKND